MEDKVDFLLVKHKSSLKVDTIFFRCAEPGMSKVPKIISLQYFKENVKDEIFADKHQRLLQNDIILGMCGQVCPNYPKKNKFRGI